MLDSIGENVFYYFQGWYIYNIDGQRMEGGDSINLGYIWNLSVFGFYILLLLGLLLLYLGRENEYLYFYQWYDFLCMLFLVCCFFLRNIYYFVIDMFVNEGLGVVIFKGNVLMDVYNVGFGMIKIVDNVGWWLVFGQYQFNIYYIYWVDSSGVYLYWFDILGINIYENLEKVD